MSSRIVLGALALGLFSIAFLAPSALAAAHTWNVEAHDDGTATGNWFTISGDAACVGAKNPTCTLAAGDTVTVNFAQKGTANSSHNFEVKFNTDSSATAIIPCCKTAGATGTGSFTVPQGAASGSYYCLPHQTLGMMGTITVTGGSPSTPGFETPLVVLGLVGVALLVSRRK